MDKAKQSKLKGYFQSLLCGTWITARNLSRATGLTLQEATQFLDEHVQKGNADKRKAVRCPECGFIIKRITREEQASNEWCYNCDAHFDAKYNCTTDVYDVSQLRVMYL